MGKLRPTVLSWEHSLPLETRPSPTWVKVTMLNLDVAGETVLVYVGSKNSGLSVCAFLCRNTFTLNRLPCRSESLNVKDMNVHRWVSQFPTFKVTCVQRNRYSSLRLPSNDSDCMDLYSTVCEITVPLKVLTSQFCELLLQ